MIPRYRGSAARKLAVALLLAAACGEMSVTAVDVALVEVVPDTASVMVGGSRQLEARLRDASGNSLNGRPVTWSSSDPERARVDEVGRITGVAAGTVTITATSGGASAQATITVLPAAAIHATPERLDLVAEQGGAPLTRGISLGNHGPGSVSGLTVPITYPAGQPTGWLTASLQSTSTPTTLVLTATPGTLAQGVYQATATVESTTPGSVPRAVTVELRVTATGPSIQLGASSASFNATQGAADPPSQSVAVTNAGGGSLAGLGASVTYAAGQPPGWLVASLSPSTAPSTLTLAAQSGSLPAGTYQATVLIISPVAGNSPRSLGVTLTVGPPSPVIALSENSRLFTATAGGGNPGAHVFAVTNAGGGTLGGLTTNVTYGAGQPSDWVTATLSNATAPATLSVQPRTGSLPVGTYTANVEVRSTTAANSPQNIAITFQIGAPAIGPAIALAPDTATFVAAAGGANPAARDVQVANAGGGTLDGLSSSVSYGVGQAGWLSATLASATAPTTLTLQPNIAGLAAGTYTATVAIASAVATNSPRTVSVTLQIGAAPVPPTIALSGSTAAFAAQAGGGDPSSQAISVNNSGGGALGSLSTNIAYASGQPTGWLTASLTSTTAPSTLTVQPRTGTLAAGTYNATVQVQAPGASNTPQSVAVTFTVTNAPAPPAIGLSPTSIGFAAVQGAANPASQTVSIANIGGGSVTGLSTITRYGTGQATGWLTASLNSTTAPATLTLQATTGVLLPATYTAIVEVRSTSASNSPQNVAVTFQVTAPIVPPAIGLSRTSVPFTATAGGNNPSAETVDVTNGGGGSLDDLTTAVVYATGQPSGWLTATLGSATAPTQVTLRATTGILPAGTYNATVEVRSVKSSNSPRTITVSFQVNSGVTVPAAPTNLKADARGDDEIELTWDDNSNNEVNFVVQRSAIGPGLWTFSVTLPANTRQYRDEGLRDDTRYWYRVLACNAAGCSASNTANDKTDD